MKTMWLAPLVSVRRGRARNTPDVIPVVLNEPETDQLPQSTSPELASVKQSGWLFAAVISPALGTTVATLRAPKPW